MMSYLEYEYFKETFHRNTVFQPLTIWSEEEQLSCIYDEKII